MRAASLGLLAALAFAGAAPGADADPNRLFADSRLIVRERFSDEVVGRGPDLFLIPGAAASRAVWRAAAERLRAHYRLHLIQVAGFAGEPARANATGEVVGPTTEAIEAYLVEEKLTPAVLVGHSLGGSMVLELAERHPEHVHRAMLVETPAFTGAGPGVSTAEEARPAASALRASVIKGGAPLVSILTGLSEAMATAQADQKAVLAWGLASDPAVVAQAFYDDMVLDLRPGLPDLKAALVVLYADPVLEERPNDPQKARYEGFYGSAPAVKLVRIQGSRHYVMLDRPEAFAAALDRFLAAP